MVHQQLKLGICIPTLNAGTSILHLCKAIKAQNLLAEELLIIDSSSTDATSLMAISMGCSVVEIAQKEFCHGKTRQYGVKLLADVDVIVFLTQDVILASAYSLANLVSKFDNPQVGAVYGRQLPRKEAGLVEAHARLFNYPPELTVRALESVSILGFKAIFFSNSFGAIVVPLFCR